MHGAGGVQALYPLYYPRPGYPVNIDDTYQKTLANAREWAMLPGPEPGLLCTVGLTSPDGTGCISGMIRGRVPLIMNGSGGIPLSVPAGKKVLDYHKVSDTSVYYEALGAYLKDKQKTTGTLKQRMPILHHDSGLKKSILQLTGLLAGAGTIFLLHQVLE